MLIPTFEATGVVQLEGANKGFYTDVWHNLVINLLQEMQRTVSNEGFVIPSLNSADRATIAASFNTDGGVEKGTLVFAPDIVNGGTSMQPNGQLMILLGDGTFHPITNT